MRAAAEKPLDPPPLLLDAKAASHLLGGIGLSLFYQLDSAGKIPQPITLNSKRLWVYEELVLFCRHHAPSRESTEWQSLLVELRGNPR